MNHLGSQSRRIHAAEPRTALHRRVRYIYFVSLCNRLGSRGSSDVAGPRQVHMLLKWSVGSSNLLALRKNLNVILFVTLLSSPTGAGESMLASGLLTQ
jgi:hypothetical protein